MTRDGNLADVAYEALKQKLIEGYVPGSPVAQDEVAASLGMSKTPIREALRRLEADGLVRQVNNRGYWMVDFSDSHIVEIFEIREALEGAAARMAAQRSSDAELDALRSRVDTIAALDESEAGSREELGVEVHQFILRNARNERLADIVEAQLVLVKVVGRALALAAPPIGQSAYAEHLTIVESLLDRDPERAELAMRAHLSEARARILSSRPLLGDRTRPSTEGRGQPEQLPERERGSHVLR